MRKTIFAAAIASLTVVSSYGQVVISEVDITNARVELVNLGTGDVNLAGYRWCNRVNGSPFYPGVSSSTINSTLSTATTLLIGPGEILVFNLSSGFILANAELGLYLPSGSFGSRSAMVDYVNWGTSTGARDTVADNNPAIWTTNGAIPTTGIQPGQTIQLKLNAPGNQPSDYEIADQTLGTAQSVEAPGETVLEIVEVGFVDSDTLFIEFEYDGSQNVRVLESSNADSPYTPVSGRTPVTEESSTRFTFDITGTSAFFRLEEE